MRKDREAQVEAQKKEMEIKGKEKENRELVDRSALSVDEAVKLWGEGLDLEASNSSARAVGSLTTAEAKLLFAKANIDAGLKKSKDAGVISRLTELNKSADQWLVRVYIALGRVAAVDSLDYVQALRWINKAIKIDPDNDKAFALKLSITESAMRARIESSRPPR
jgi:tetratricopeptide (TPR) repeat protein